MEGPQPQQRPGSQRTRLGVYHDVLRRLRDAAAPEALAPDFADRLWAHFHRFSVRYALDVNAERAEDVLVHMQLLDRAKHSENQPAFSVRVVQVPAPPELDATEPDSSEPNSIEEGASATSGKLNVHQSQFLAPHRTLRPLYVKPAAGTSWMMAMLFSDPCMKSLLHPRTGQRALLNCPHF